VTRLLGLPHLLRVCLFRACRRGLKRPTEIINQDIDADQEHPQREDQYNPVNIAPAEQEKQRQGKAEKRDPAWGDTGAHRECRRRDHEYRRHLNRIEIHDLVGDGASEGERRLVEQTFGPSSISYDESARHSGGGEKHGEEQKPAAEKDGGKKAVFKLSQAVAQHADEP